VGDPLPLSGDEAPILLSTLDRNRRTFAWKCAGLDAAGLGRTHPPSTLTLAGLMKHMALVEDHYFTHVLHGRPMPAPWDAVDFDEDPMWEFRTAVDDHPDELRELWRASVRRSRAAIDEVLDDEGLDRITAVPWGDGRELSLRRLVVDMIEEYARHTGHADLLRESIDGATGENPPSDFTWDA
jgi:uncharacterized damage-inducible protein DinB